ncbi:MAG: hypothetical protein JXA57_09295 [Armatimonadetes bacterium]|nr:hypothetical protein [Armatimonadota bacterium]
MIHQEDDLIALCRPRPLPGIEYFGGNELYGYANVVKDYAGFDREKSLPVLVPHGVCLNENYVSIGEKRAGYPAVLSYPAFRDRVYERRMRMLVIPSASPFLYALQTTETPAIEREGVLFFPAHSIQGVEAVQDWNTLAGLLCALNQNWGPVRVCVYWADVLAGRHRVFAERGLSVVSAGHNHDPEFIVRLISFLRGHRYVSSNAPGSHLFYAVAAGCEFFFLGEFHSHAGTPRTLARQIAPASPSVSEELDRARLLASSPDHGNSDLLRELAAKYLRADSLLSREDMQRHLQLCTELDRKGTLFVAGVPALRGPLPRAWYRWLKKRLARLLGRRRKPK